MTPLDFLISIVVMSALAVGLSYVQRQRRVRRLRALATQWQLHYSESDCFRLAPRVALRLSVPGAAAVRVTDLLYGLEDRSYRYIFRTEYVVGVLRSKTGVHRVATFREPRDASGDAAVDIVFAPHDLPLIEQYRHLHDAAKSAG